MLQPIEPRAVPVPESVPVPELIAPLISAIRNGTSMRDSVNDVVRAMGFETFMYGVALGSARDRPFPVPGERYYVWATVPPAWIAEYDQNSYIEVDPRLSHSLQPLPPPLVWDQSIGEGNELVSRFLDRAAAHGIGSGLVIYFHDDSSKAVVALNSPERRLSKERRARVASQTGNAMLLGSMFHSIFMRDVVEKGAPPPQQGCPLSPREIQCLELAARGMTSIDIGIKLGIAERTANFHFTNIISKLGVLNRGEAIAMGIAHKLIQLSERAPKPEDLPTSKIRDAQIKRWIAIRKRRQS